MGSISYTCGVPFPSGCVIYTGELPEFILPADIPCNPTLDDIIKKSNEKIQELLDNSDLTQLDKGCFSFDPLTVKIKELHQEEINKICDHASRILAVENALINLDISSQLIDIDLGCLAPSAEACAQGANSYSLLSILLTLRSEICSIKSYLNL